MAEWEEKQNPSIGCLQETQLRHKDTQRPKVQGWKKTFQARGNQKKARVAVLITEKINYKTKIVVTDKYNFKQ